jgi:hypothetical protein
MKLGLSATSVQPAFVIVLTIKPHISASMSLTRSCLLSLPLIGPISDARVNWGARPAPVCAALRCLVGNCVNVSEALLPISAHLILQPVALLLRPALSKSILLVASNSRQLTNSTSAFGSDGIRASTNSKLAIRVTYFPAIEIDIDYHFRSLV